MAAVMILAFLWIVLGVASIALAGEADGAAPAAMAFIASTVCMFSALSLANHVAASPEHRAAKAHRVIELATVAAAMQPALATLEAAAATAEAAMTAAAER